ncbi:MAG: hypothetical protein Q8M65_10415, partial [Rhodoglobus sp.]|nr:hypothetical protein [Rhodoglobus sp.]
MASVTFATLRAARPAVRRVGPQVGAGCRTTGGVHRADAFAPRADRSGATAGPGRRLAVGAADVVDDAVAVIVAA